MQDGCIFLDKPPRVTSQQAVSAIKRSLGIKKAGHTGTLDPMATGLLIVLLGKATKLASRFSCFQKEYLATFELGKTSDTYDTDGQVIATAPVPDVSINRISEVTRSFIGDIIQTPPPYSAKKVRGKRLYWYARRNIPVESRPHPVSIHVIEVTGLNLPFVEMRIVCSTGTYIRSLINDIGAVLGCGAVMTALRRTRIGAIDVSTATTMNQIEKGGYTVMDQEQTGGLVSGGNNIHRYP